MTVSKTILQYKEFNQLQEYAVAQEQTILQLSKKMQKLEEERDHLKKLLETSMPLIKTEGQESSAEKILTSSEEHICVTQLEKLRDISSSRELTLEETRRVEIFSKVLNIARNAPKTIEPKHKQLDTKQMLALVESDDAERQ
jgi:hypothetical protein